MASQKKSGGMTCGNAWPCPLQFDQNAAIGSPLPCLKKIPGSGAEPRSAPDTGGNDAPHTVTTTINLFSHVSGEMS